MSNGSSISLPWLATGVAAVLAAGALGYFAGRYSAPDPTVATAPEPAPGATTEIHGDWTLYCQDGTAGKRICFAMQEISDDAKRPTLVVIAGYDDAAVRTLLVRTPVGVRLDAGLEFAFGGKDQGAFQFDACDSASCNATLRLPEQGYPELEKAGAFDLTYTRGDGSRVQSRVSMNGLSAAYAKIERPVPPPAPATPPAEAPAETPAEPAPAAPANP